MARTEPAVAGRPIAVLGAGGRLGRELVRVLHGRAIPISHAELDLGDATALERVLTALQPGAVINAAAFNQVDQAETHRQQALTANAQGPAALARLAAREGWGLLHFSTDYVFGGDGLARPRRESDPPAPVNFYGYTKLLGEEAVLALHPRALVVRVAHLYAGISAPGRASLVDRFLDQARHGQPIRVTAGQFLTPTSVSEVAPAAVSLLEAGEAGLFHLAGEGGCTAQVFAQAVLYEAGLTATVEITAADPRPARRALHTVLENRRWVESGRPPIRPWRQALAAYLRREPRPRQRL